MTGTTGTSGTGAPGAARGAGHEAVKDRLGKVGVWLGSLNWASSAASREAVAEIEDLGYGSVWLSETPATKDPFGNAGMLLASTRRIVFGTGIAVVWARDATAMNAGAQTLGEAFPGRFVLGLGVSHYPSVTTRGHTYERPLAKMRDYLDEMAAASWDPPTPAEPVPTVLAALRPGMLSLARDRTDGAHPYFVPASHTAKAREVLGDGPLLVPEQAVLVETDPERARAKARDHTSIYLSLPNYVNNLRSLGFSEDDVQGGGSDRLVDAVVAWGSVETIRARVQEHLLAGADSVLVQPLEPDHGLGLDQLRELAPALLG